MEVTEDLMIQVSSGNEQAYERLFELNWDHAVRTCWLILRHQHDAEEVAQEAFLKLYVHRRELRDPKKFRSWFYRILVNTAFDRVRKRKLVVNIDELTLVAESDDFRRADRRMVIDEAMKTLSYEERTAIVLVHFNGCTEPEAAEAAGWRLGKLKYRLNRARSALARVLDDEGLSWSAGKGSVKHV